MHQDISNSIFTGALNIIFFNQVKKGLASIHFWIIRSYPHPFIHSFSWNFRMEHSEQIASLMITDFVILLIDSTFPEAEYQSPSTISDFGTIKSSVFQFYSIYFSQTTFFLSLCLSLSLSRNVFSICLYKAYIYSSYSSLLLDIYWNHKTCRTHYIILTGLRHQWNNIILLSFYCCSFIYSRVPPRIIWKWMPHILW